MRKWTPHKFLTGTFLFFNKNVSQAATRATRLQMLKIEQKHRMTSPMWGRGCLTKYVIDHRTWSIIGHSTISFMVSLGFSISPRLIPKPTLLPVKHSKRREGISRCIHLSVTFYSPFLSFSWNLLLCINKTELVVFTWAKIGSFNIGNLNIM